MGLSQSTKWDTWRSNNEKTLGNKIFYSKMQSAPLSYIHYKKQAIVVS